MKLSCGLMEDLLPLYADGGCTEETARAVREHLAACPECGKKYELMSMAGPVWEDEQTAEEAILQKYGRKVRKGRRLRCLLVILLALCCLLLGGLTALTLHQMALQNDPVVYAVEEGVWNLTAGPLSVPAEEAEAYTLYTNYTQIQVDAEAQSDFEAVTGTVYLYNADHPEPILQFELTGDDQSGTFTGLSSVYRYRVEVECDQEIRITISEGRKTDFFSCFCVVVNELISALLY